ncbi:hypothetical protein HOH67_01675, partial [Candidatus Peregrinibacteria bacterium]|nr:hypothetical protein [Candidatus Peregrinibacteria bacterium]
MKKDTITIRKEENKQLIVNQLKKTPVVEVACKKISIGRASYYRWRNEDEAFKQQADDALLIGKHFINDMAESQLIRAIQEGNMTSIIFWLKNHHRDYRTKVELSGELRTKGELTDEQKILIQKALKHAGLSLNKKLLTNPRKMELPKNLNDLIQDQKTRRELTYGSHFLFFHTYFSHYIDCKTADFQKEMFSLTEDMSVKSIVIVAFRGSGKSTIMNMSFPLWSILGKPQCKYVIIVGLTQGQAKRHLKNIKQELENNQLLKADLGPFNEIENDWSSYTLEIPELGARITAVSIDQSIRGTRHGSHRPDLIICD